MKKIVTGLGLSELVYMYDCQVHINLHAFAVVHNSALPSCNVECKPLQFFVAVIIVMSLDIIPSDVNSSFRCLNFSLSRHFI